MSEQIRSGLYYVIPAEVMDSELIGPEEKLLYGLLSGYAHSTGECYPSDAHLSKRMNLHLRNLQRHIRNLEKFGFISRRIEPTPENPFKKRRYITVHTSFKKCLRNDTGVVCETDSGVGSETTPVSVIVSEDVLVSEDVSCSGGVPPNFSNKKPPLGKQKNNLEKKTISAKQNPQECETLEKPTDSKEKPLTESESLKQEIIAESLTLSENLVIPSPKGGNIKISLSYVMLKFIKERKDYTTKEIHYAWKCLAEKKGGVYDPIHYIEGVIKKARTMSQNRAYQNKKAKEAACRTQTTSNQSLDQNNVILKSENYREGSSEKGTKGLTSLSALLKTHFPSA